MSLLRRFNPSRTAGLLRLSEPRSVKNGARVCDSQRLGWSRRTRSKVRRIEVPTLLRLLEPRSGEAGARSLIPALRFWSATGEGIIRATAGCQSSAVVFWRRLGLNGISNSARRPWPCPHA